MLFALGVRVIEVVSEHRSTWQATNLRAEIERQLRGHAVVGVLAVVTGGAAAEPAAAGGAAVTTEAVTAAAVIRTAVHASDLIHIYEACSQPLDPRRAPGPIRYYRSRDRVTRYKHFSAACSVPAGLDRVPVAGVQRLDRIRGADHPPDLDIVVEERK